MLGTIYWFTVVTVRVAVSCWSAQRIMAMRYLKDIVKKGGGLKILLRNFCKHCNLEQIEDVRQIKNAVK